MKSINWGFCDLSVSDKFNLSNLKLIEKLGFNTIAVNTYIEETSEEPKKKKKKGEVKEKQDFPLPVTVDKEGTKLNILSRITLEFSDSMIAHKITQSESLKKYDIIAVVPKTLSAFQYACGSMDVDIISFEPEIRMPFKVSRKLYRQAVDRGLFFELPYAPMIKDSMSRKNIITAGHMYHAVGKSKNILVTSNADQYSYMRGAYDVINLGFLLGLNDNESLESIRNNARRLILKCQGRRCRKLFVSIDKSNDDNKT